MTIIQFLALFYPVVPTKKGWDVCCPAHDDHSPSLGVMEGANGRIVLNCWAGCTPESICARLGLTLADLFEDRPLNGSVRPILTPPKPRTRLQLAFAFELHAFDLREAADKILAAARDCEECDTWTNEDLDQAMKAVSRAYIYQARATFCEDYADHLKEREYATR